MKIALLDNITGFGKHDWSVYWVLIWFSCGLLALFFGFWTTTEQTALDWFYLLVSADFVGDFTEKFAVDYER